MTSSPTPPVMCCRIENTYTVRLNTNWIKDGMFAPATRQHMAGGARGVNSPLALSLLCPQLSSSSMLPDKSQFVEQNKTNPDGL